ncbi:MAG: sugar ABC transporter permease [Lachnospiraceae bacterium]|nr:sugar ABC transporter permease [Lachnospiraceae bacterium]
MKKNKVSFAFVLPAFVIYTALLVIPIVMALGISFFKWNGFNEMTFVGVKNYVSLFHDARLGNAVINTVIIAGTVIVTVNILGLLLAMLVNRPSKGNNFFRTIFFIPFVLSAVALSFVWKSILSYNGVLNGLLEAVGLGELVGNWLGKRNSALACIIIIEIWRTLGYHMMLYLAALQTIPEELYEACTMDGGNRWDKFRNVTLPLIVPGMSVSLLMSIINELRIYDVVKIMTDGGPGYATETIVYNIVAQGFSSNIVGYSSAIAVVLFLVIGTLSIVVVTQMGKREVEV